MNENGVLVLRDRVVPACLALADARDAALAGANKRLTRGLDLRSRRGVDDALWKILVLSLVAALAAGVLFVLGPKLLELGRNAVNRVQSPPW